MACSSRIGVCLLRKPGNMHSPRFLNMFSAFCAALYNMALVLSYLLQVRYEWSEEKLKRYHPFFIFNRIYFVLVLVTSIIPCSAYIYHGCWACEIAASPLGCDAKDSGVDCICGANTKNQFLFSSGIPLVLVNIVIVTA